MEKLNPAPNSGNEAQSPWPNATALEQSVYLTGYRLAQVQLQAMHERETASTDEITGLLNRRGFIDRSTELLQDSKATDSFMVMFVDINRFKLVNDTLGHKQGDDVLRTVGSSLVESLPTSVVARFGGDEFAIFHLVSSGEFISLSRGHKEISEINTHVTNRCNRALSEMPLVGSLGTSVAIGSSALQNGNPNNAHQTLDELLRQADDTMYDLKPDRLSSVRHRS